MSGPGSPPSARPAGRPIESTPSPAAYGIAKAALNALTLVVAAATPSSVKVDAVCPGWVRTDMGGEWAPTTVERGADTIGRPALLPETVPRVGSSAIAAASRGEGASGSPLRTAWHRHATGDTGTRVPSRTADADPAARP
ncbi:SDR family oxidoreductase [Streptomyces sp. NPDC006208]|uniref:SDR family oxidoreductase n=1 Tax=Streptomyces sp. NPDC006208 TaxID=3156734 RepID=UPI0033B59593